jgi:hypothetical protein
MLVAGIDVGAEVHHVALVDECEAVVTRPTAFEENAPGYEKLFALLARRSTGWRRPAPGEGERAGAKHAGGDGSDRPLLAEPVCGTGGQGLCGRVASGHLLGRQTPPPFQHQPKPTVGVDS